ncbi:MAG: crotonase/enoyl-CoA hydratase family protein [Gammaproteobacteria bacterium]|nr:crotonase/enoyl-CoA hydratase family protein [Gammaproteobacteria bacterium]
MSDRVLLDIRDDVAYVTFNRPDKYNGLDREMMLAMVDTAKKIKKDRSIRAVILQGEGKAFCAGLDFASWSKTPAKLAAAFLKPRPGTTNLVQEVAWCWRKLSIPVIAVTRGHCFGGGIQIALAADFRFTTPDCEFSIMEIKWGMIPDMTGTIPLRELTSMDVAKELTMTGRIFKGNEAMALGLVTGVSDDPLKDAEELVAAIKTRSPDGVSAAKALFHKTWSASESSALGTESIIQAKVLAGKNQRIVTKANFAKKLPKFITRQFDY